MNEIIAQQLEIAQEKKDKLEEVLVQIQPDASKRKLVGSSLNAFMAQEKIKFSQVSDENKLLLVTTLFRIGIQISKDTIYPRMHQIYNAKTKKSENVLIIQDNYLFLQKLILEHTKADNLIVDIIYNKEFDHLAGIKIDNNFNKTSVLTIDQIDYDQKFEDIHSVFIGVTGKNITNNTFRIYSKQALLDRAGDAKQKGMIWKGHPTIDKGTLNHNKLEMIKKTAIRAFVKERYGSALELIRTIDIAQNRLNQNLSVSA